MAERYYLVKQRQNPKASFWETGHVFVSVSEGELEHITGDRVIFSLLELRDGELGVSERAQLNYDILPFKDKTQCDLYRADRGGRTCGTGRTRTFRDTANKRILVGEI